MLFVLDRDGVINIESDKFIKSPDEWIPIANSIKAIAQLSQAGHRVVVATNQSGVNRKLLSLDTLGLIHQKMIDVIEAVGGKIEKIYFCPHLPDENCECRKPKPGLLHDIHRDFQVPFNEMIVIGDSLRDLQAGELLGCQLVLVKTGNGKKTLSQLDQSFNVKVYDDLLAAVEAMG